MAGPRPQNPKYCCDLAILIALAGLPLSRLLPTLLTRTLPAAALLPPATLAGLLLPLTRTRLVLLVRVLVRMATLTTPRGWLETPT